MATTDFFLLQIVETIDCAFHLIINHLFNTFLLGKVHGKGVTRPSIFVMNKSWTFRLRIDMLLTYSGHCTLSRIHPTPKVNEHQTLYPVSNSNICRVSRGIIPVSVKFRKFLASSISRFYLYKSFITELLITKVCHHSFINSQYTLVYWEDYTKFIYPLHMIIIFWGYVNSFCVSNFAKRYKHL